MPETTKAEELYQRLHPIIGEHDHDIVLGVLRAAFACPVCGASMSGICPACSGRAGGSRMTTKKWRQLKNAAKQRWKKPRKKQEGP